MTGVFCMLVFNFNLLYNFYNILNTFTIYSVLQRITDEGSVPEMSIIMVHIVN